MGPQDLAGVFRQGNAASRFFTDDDAGVLERVRWVLDEMADAAEAVAVRREKGE